MFITLNYMRECLQKYFLQSINIYHSLKLAPSQLVATRTNVQLIKVQCVNYKIYRELNGLSHRIKRMPMFRCFQRNLK